MIIVCGCRAGPIALPSARSSLPGGDREEEEAMHIQLAPLASKLHASY